MRLGIFVHVVLNQILLALFGRGQIGYLAVLGIDDDAFSGRDAIDASGDLPRRRRRSLRDCEPPRAREIGLPVGAGAAWGGLQPSRGASPAVRASVRSAARGKQAEENRFICYFPYA